MSELIIYWWSPAGSPASRDEVLSTFLAGAAGASDGAKRASVEDRIQVVVYSDKTPPVFLATP